MMMAGARRIKVLLGFKLRSDDEDRDVEKRLTIQLKTLGYEPTILRRSTKKEIQSYLKDNTECCHAVLMEMVGMATWSQNELAELVDDRDIRVVVVLTAARARQTEYLTTLYAAGITSAIFEHGHRGASAEEVAELLVRPRSRREARRYYGIEMANIAIRSLTNEMYNGYCCRLMDKENGPSVMARLLKIAESVNPYQMGDLLSKLPQDILDELWQYTEYAQLRAQLKESGIRVPYHRPRNARSMEDDLSFNADAGRVLNDRGIPAGAFVKGIVPRRRFLGIFGAKKKGMEMQEEANILQRRGHTANMADIIEGLGFMGTEGYEETDGDEDGHSIQLNLRGARSQPPQSTGVTAASGSAEGPGEEGLIFYS